MKKLFFFFLILIFCEKIFAQEHYILVSANNRNHCDTLQVGDYVKVGFAIGKSITGYIPKIEKNYFVVGYDTILPETVKKISFEKRYPRKVGKNMQVGGAVVIGSGIGIIVFGITRNNAGVLVYLFGGAAIIVSGAVVIIAGSIIRLAEKHAIRFIGDRWQFRIV